MADATTTIFPNLKIRGFNPGDGSLGSLGGDKIEIITSKYLPNLVENALNLAAYAFMISLIVSGFYYLLSSGSEEKTEKAKKNIVFSSIGFVIIFASYAIFDFVVAKGGKIEPSVASVNIVGLIGQGVDIALAIAGAIVMLVMVINGFTYLLNSGNSEATAKARKAMLNAAIGLLIIMLSFAAASWMQSKVSK
ncbi:MAG: hypothetical protein CEN91_367 [Candidatus Berkelbacteria bacterium Licking1014_85]|uniref:Uncharacterized protein n=1 Tax=Candidatus Berkelbacteria bacterium Licking1014_85 TaxID=2017148 RepID=A0A554LIX5_9BACT|nr:MAG: hypothetical protein CEN91_367 [Candidatus Berkelbacteria bacterium Licking1014_85]